MPKLILRLAFAAGCFYISRELSLDRSLFHKPTLGYYRLFAEEFYDFIVSAPGDLERLAKRAK